MRASVQILAYFQPHPPLIHLNPSLAAGWQCSIHTHGVHIPWFCYPDAGHISGMESRRKQEYCKLGGGRWSCSLHKWLPVLCSLKFEYTMCRYPPIYFYTRPLKDNTLSSLDHEL